MTEEDVTYFQDLVLEKLQGVERSGNGATIHDAKTYIGKINLARKIYYSKSNDTALRNWSEAVDEAEYWLMSVANW